MQYKKSYQKYIDAFCKVAKLFDRDVEDVDLEIAVRVGKRLLALENNQEIATNLPVSGIQMGNR